MADIAEVFRKRHRYYRGGHSAHLSYVELKTLILWLEEKGHMPPPVNKPIVLTEEGAVSDPGTTGGEGNG